MKEKRLYRIELTFGHRRATGELLPLQLIAQTENTTVDTFSTMFGGGQLTHRLGGCLLDGQLMIEPCTHIYAFVERTDGFLEQLWSLAETIGSQLQQDSVLIAITPVVGMVSWVAPRVSAEALVSD